jgi:ectoine hydroxylase-related dioxygenase (phytanoyl-CoA dioxygenase family)
MTSNARAHSALTDSLINQYKENGAVCIRQLFNTNEIELLRQGIDENLAHPSPRFKVASRPDDTGRFVEDFCMWETNPYYKQFIYQSPCSAVAGILMESSTSRLYHDHLLVKEANTKQITPWHQDQPYYNIEGNETCSLWIAVDPVPRYSTLEFISGSHRGEHWLMPRTFMNMEAKWFPEGTLQEIPDINANRTAFPIIGWAVEPGDVIAFHMLTLHGARGTTADEGRRRVYSVRFLGDDVTHAPRKWITSPDFSDIIQEIKAGAPMDHPRFPILWRSTQ